ncbi:SDR family oxidoreductase [Marinomonas transparens]|uniref:NAD(P)H-binding protein n=1 Tax=Marinomonas transparens TaxID=2795388 RepID=A0A934N0K7_9GAMM|nr:NAD(P)H-binding protein [Marinomonas transparens]MBJ7538660.1 NAD(P)H-binding protein [Marinomonas transparens]
MKSQPILIIGKNGKTGARVNQQLLAQGITTRAVSRSTTPSFDWEKPDSWRTAMAGSRAAYVTFQPDLAIPSAEQSIRDFVRLALELELEHIVLLSGRGEDGAQRAEKVLQQSGLTWNIVRASWFQQNFSESFMAESLANGELFLPVGDVAEPFVDADDIADVAVAALTQPHLHNQVFEVTGPRPMTFSQCIEEISTAVGYPIHYRQIPIDHFIGALQEQGASQDIQWLMRELFTVVFDGRNSDITYGVEQALGRPATDFRHYIKKTLSSGVWDKSC